MRDAPFTSRFCNARGREGCLCLLHTVETPNPSGHLLQVLRAGGHYVLVSCRDPDVRLPLAQQCGIRMQVRAPQRCARHRDLYGVACYLTASLMRHAELTHVA